MFNEALKFFLLDLSIQGAGFTISEILNRTEKFYDFFGTNSFLLLSFFSVIFKKMKGGNVSWKDYAVLGMIFSWGLRLAVYLGKRILLTGKDKRLEQFKSSIFQFAGLWIGQVIWVLFVGLPVYIYLGIPKPPMANINNLEILGLIIFIVGFLFESISDYQKSQHRSKNKQGWIFSGLWKYSRHPNYFGEILIWIGINLFVILPIFKKTPISIVYPILSISCIVILLGLVSGVPLLEKSGLKRYGHDELYQEYLQKVPVLVILGWRYWISLISFLGVLYTNYQVNSNLTHFLILGIIYLVQTTGMKKVQRIQLNWLIIFLSFILNGLWLFGWKLPIIEVPLLLRCQPLLFNLLICLFVLLREECITPESSKSKISLIGISVYFTWIMFEFVLNNFSQMLKYFIPIISKDHDIIFILILVFVLLSVLSLIQTKYLFANGNRIGLICSTVVILWNLIGIMRQRSDELIIICSMILGIVFSIGFVFTKSVYLWRKNFRESLQNLVPEFV